MIVSTVRAMLPRRLLATAALTAVAGFGGLGGPSDADARPDLTTADTFGFAIGERHLKRPMSALAGYDLVVVDGEEATAQQVAALRAGGAVVLGYLSVGTVESWRSWYPQVKRYGMEAWDDWEGERFADTSKAGFRDAIAGRIAPQVLAKGFDGLFLDNVAMVEDHPKQRAGMFALVRRLDGLLGPDRLLFAQNGEDAIGPALAHLDGWNREDVTGVYDFDRKRYVATPAADRRAALRAVRRMKARGLFVTTTDYTASDGHARTAHAIRGACAAGAVPFVSDIHLNRLPRPAATCAG